MTWKRQEERLEFESIPSEEEFLRSIQNIKDKTDQFIITLYYATAARVTEVIGRKELKKFNYYHKLDPKDLTKKTRLKKPIGWQTYKAIKPLTKDKITIEDIEQEIFIKGKKHILKRKVLLIELFNEKAKSRDLRHKKLPLPFDTHKDIIDIILTNIEKIPYGKPVVSLPYHKIWRLMSKYELNPHLLRHYRLTHLCINHRYDSFKLQLYAGWTDIKPAKHYIQMAWSSLLDGL